MRIRRGPVPVVIFLLVSGLLYQNCAKQNFSRIESESKPTDTEGYCVKGIRLAIWTDQNRDWSTDGETKIGHFISYTGSLTTVQNYGYSSASAHPTFGPTPSDFEGAVFFYQGSDGLSLNFFFNVDEAGSAENSVNLDIKTRGNLSADTVLVTDDPNATNGAPAELRLMSTAGGQNNYEGRFHYWYNTDGGAIGPFNGENYLVQFRFLDLGDVQKTAFYSANGQPLSLTNSGSTSQVDTFLIKSEGYESCL